MCRTRPDPVWPTGSSSAPGWRSTGTRLRLWWRRSPLRCLSPYETADRTDERAPYCPGMRGGVGARGRRHLRCRNRHARTRPPGRGRWCSAGGGTLARPSTGAQGARGRRDPRTRPPGHGRGRVSHGDRLVGDQPGSAWPGLASPRPPAWRRSLADSRDTSGWAAPAPSAGAPSFESCCSAHTGAGCHAVLPPSCADRPARCPRTPSLPMLGP